MRNIKFSFIAILLTSILSCKSVEQVMQKELDKVYVGMPIKEFRKSIPKASVVYFDDVYACYKLTKRYAKFGDPNHYSYETRFFYFRDGELWKVNEGERAVDYRIKIDD